MSEEIFSENVRRFRDYAASRGAYFDARGFLIYRGKVLTKADSEYLAAVSYTHLTLPTKRIV